MSRRVQICVSGGSKADPELARLAEAVGRGIAQAGAVLVCGGRGGVMEAAARGAADAGGEVVGILPGTSPDEGNPHVTYVIATGIGHARNLAVVASADAVIAIGGEWGTLSEIAYARRLERPVIALESWSLSGRAAMKGGPGIEPAESAEEAVAMAMARAEARRESTLSPGSDFPDP
jgi:uncharacterized protein (TIGR00725 family)